MKTLIMTITATAMMMLGTAAADAKEGSGLPTGQRMHKPFVKKSAPAQIVSPRDSASGLPTGKRMHKPLVVTKRIDKMVPLSVKGPAIAPPGAAAKQQINRSKSNVKNNL